MPRDTFITAVYLILKNERDEFCLIRRFNTGYMDGHYSLPAGHLESGESLKEAMAREAKEEIGVEINLKDLTLVHVSHNLISKPERIECFFTAKTWVGEITNCEPNKCDDISWFTVQNIPENTTTTVKTAIKCYVEGKMYSEFRGD